MAIIAATGNGVWNSPSVWTSGLIPGTGDIAVINNRSITQDVNILCDQIRFDGANFGNTNGGQLFISSLYSFDISALLGGGLNGINNPNISSSASAVLNITTIYGGRTFGGSPCPTIGSYGGTLVINCYNIYGGSSSVIKNFGTGDITINASGVLALNGGLQSAYEAGNIVNIINGSININAQRITNAASFGGSIAPSVLNSALGTITISGILSSLEGNDSANAIVVNNAGGTVNVFGEIYPIISHGIQNVSSGVINVNGFVRGGRTGGSTRYGILNSANGTVNVTGIVNGLVVGVAANTAGNGIFNNSNGTVNVVGDVIMEAGGVNVTNAAIYNNANGTINVSGNVTGASANAAPGIHNASTGSVFVNGIAFAGRTSPAVRSSSTGYVYVKRAVGNDFGAGSVGFSNVVAVQNDATGQCYVEEIVFGNRGQNPVFGAITVLDKPTNVAVVKLSNEIMKTLGDVAVTSGLLPSSSDVRNGVVYNNGLASGTMVVPNANTVSYGVPVDSGVGNVILTGADFWNYLSSNISTSGTIGNRLKNCSTVETAGKQLENSLS